MSATQQTTTKSFDLGAGFIAEHDLWSDAQREAAAVALETIQREGLKRMSGSAGATSTASPR